MTNEQLRAAYLADLDALARLPRVLTSAAQRARLAGVRKLIQQADDALLTKLAGLVPAPAREETEPMAEHAMTAEQVHAFKAALPPDVVQKVEADARAAGITINWLAVGPAMMATLNMVPEIVAMGGKLGAIWAPVIAAASPPASAR